MAKGFQYKPIYPVAEDVSNLLSTLLPEGGCTSILSLRKPDALEDPSTAIMHNIPHYDLSFNLPSGSLLIENVREELHEYDTTAIIPLTDPSSRKNSNRISSIILDGYHCISLVFMRHQEVWNQVDKNNKTKLKSS